MTKKNDHSLFTKRITINAYYWLILFLAIFIPVYYFNSLDFALRIACVCISPLIPAVYINFLLLDKYFIHKKYFKYILWFILLVLISGIIAQGSVYLVIPLKEEDTFVTFFNPLFLIIFTSGARYYWHGIKLQMKLHEAQAKQYKAELDLLKYQVNPHFFFNTLNNLFAMARKQQDQSTAKGIAKLSHIMRYLIYDSNVEKIEIAKEIEQINNFIELQKLRFNNEDNINISFNIEGEISGQKIIPMLLIPFVENTFKHGISLVKESPIEINLKINNSELYFKVKNSINKRRRDRDDQNSGIGLTNVKRRLELLYPEAHELKIENDGEKFEVDLRIVL
jgi:LytS/YehU family sensor histidine kinase